MNPTTTSSTWHWRCQSDDDIVDVALALREIDPNSVPINFLIPFDGTPLGEHRELPAALSQRRFKFEARWKSPVRF